MAHNLEYKGMREVMKHTKHYYINIVLGLMGAFAFLITGCSQSEFSKRPPSYESYDVLVGKVDILFVVDNSGSMSTEQKRMAQSFPNFVQSMDLAGLDYRIGIITTDVESRNNPLKDYGQGKGALQNGNLLKFPDGKSYLDNNSVNIESQFWNTVQRQETIDCEESNFNKSVCPSGDERGIYAALLTVNANKEQFFREESHAAFIFLSDEDVRGKGLANTEYFKPTQYDYPLALIQTVKERLGASTTMSAHAIITNNESCRQQQIGQANNSNISAEIGTFYKQMTKPGNNSLYYGSTGEKLRSYADGQLVKGVVGSICSSNYSASLGSIKNVLSQKKSTERLRCQLIYGDTTLDVRLDAGYSWSLNEERDEITFTPALPAGASFHLDYECP